MAGGVPRALRPHRRLQWADRSVEPEDQEHQAHRARIPQLRQLPAPPPSQPRPNPEQSSDITDPNPPSQLGGVEPENLPSRYKPGSRKNRQRSLEKGIKSRYAPARHPGTRRV